MAYYIWEEPYVPHECTIEKNVPQGIVIKDLETGNFYCTTKENIFITLDEAQKESKHRYNKKVKEYESEMNDINCTLRFVVDHDIQKDEIAKTAFCNVIRKKYNVNI